MTGSSGFPRPDNSNAAGKNSFQQKAIVFAKFAIAILLVSYLISKVDLYRLFNAFQRAD